MFHESGISPPTHNFFTENYFGLLSPAELAHTHGGQKFSIILHSAGYRPSARLLLEKVFDDKNKKKGTINQIPIFWIRFLLL